MTLGADCEKIENPDGTAVYNNKSPPWGLMVFLMFEGHDLTIYKENQGENVRTWSTWLNNNYF